MIRRSDGDNDESSITALGFLCGRAQFCSFHEMFKCLIAVDSSVEFIYDGILSCLRFYG
jgi:hypothetical protein